MFAAAVAMHERGDPAGQWRRPRGCIGRCCRQILSTRGPRTTWVSLRINAASTPRGGDMDCPGDCRSRWRTGGVSSQSGTGLEGTRPGCGFEGGVPSGRWNCGPEYPDAWSNLGIVLAEGGEAEAAIRGLRFGRCGCSRDMLMRCTTAPTPWPRWDAPPRRSRGIRPRRGSAPHGRTSTTTWPTPLLTVCIGSPRQSSTIRLPSTPA